MKNMKVALCLALAAILCLLGTVSAKADTVFTSASDFAAATTGDTAITFTAPSPTGFTNVGATYTDAGTGTTFTVASGTIDVTGMNFYGAGTYSSDFLVGASDGFGGPNTLTITLPSGDNAFGFDIGGVFGGATLNVVLSDGSIFPITVPASFNTTFFGFTAPAGLTALSFSTSAFETFAITDAVIGSTATPEPDTILLLGVGVLAFAAVKLMKR